MKKQLKLIICLMLCTSVLLSVCMIGQNAEHNCIGEDCQVCRDIAMQREVLKSILMCIMCTGIAVCILQLTAFLPLFAETEKRRLNLVTDKIKLTA